MHYLGVDEVVLRRTDGDDPFEVRQRKTLELPEQFNMGDENPALGEIERVLQDPALIGGVQRRESSPNGVDGVPGL